MIKSWLFVLLIIPSVTLAFHPTKARNHVNYNNIQKLLNSKHTEFMTTADMLSATLSNISIKNIGAQDTTITGIYLFVLGLGAEDACASPLIESEGATFGALWSPKVTMASDETRYIGANYLYNMVMLFLYEAYIEDQTRPLGTPGSYEGGNTYCLWIGVTNQTVGTNLLTSTNGTLDNANQLVQSISALDHPISFTNVICNDSTRLCSTNDNIQPQPFPHQRP